MKTLFSAILAAVIQRLEAQAGTVRVGILRSLLRSQFLVRS